MPEGTVCIGITTSSFAQFSAEPLEMLTAKGLEYRLNPEGRTLRPEELAVFLRGCAGVVAGTEEYSKETFAALPGLRVVSRCGAGMDSVDLKAAAAAEVTVANTPDAPTRAVAELTVGLAMSLVRKTGQMDRQMHAGQWNKHMGSLLLGKRVGIVGLGRIGKASAGLFSALGCRVAFHDPYVDGAQPYPGLSLAELLRQSDLICLHLPKAPDGRPVIGAPELALMPQGSWLVNTARGGLVDEEALLEALNKKHMAGAALDVFSQEPYSGPLAGHEQVVATPHIGSYARESRIGMEIEAVANLLKALGLE